MRKIPLVLICIFLFIIPFFWFKPGEINIGGDSSRLYFYDPQRYLNSILYNIAPGQTGGEMMSYFFIPFVGFLIVLKFIFKSPSLLINLFHSFMLISAFIFIYLSVFELLKGFKKKYSLIIEISSIFAGLFYIFVSILGYNWDKALITHNQYFLNPICFYLLLRYAITNNIVYPLTVILISFIFAPNFSFIGAPSLFSFYPFALAFIYMYKKYIIKIKFEWKKIIALIILFFLVHAFHLVPQFLLILDRESNSYQRVFSSEGKNEALGYFISVASNVKLSNNFVTTASYVQSLFKWDFILLIFPLLFTYGLLLSSRHDDNYIRKKTLLLISLFFLIVIFFDTANITHIGYLFYSLLFQLPGFGMFRNYYGQFLYVSYFFYALVFGYTLFYVLVFLNLQKKILLLGFLTILVIIKGWPLISGYYVNLPFYQEESVKVPIKIDPQFEQALQYVDNLSLDGKVLTLPLTDFGYQVLAGTEGGVYMGPSMIGFLTNKKDFPGYEGFGNYSQLLFDAIKRRDFNSVKNIFAILNIRYIFYNSDSYIYDKHFKQFPYHTVREYFPNQHAVHEFITSLGAQKLVDIGLKYHLYELKDTDYLPHFYPAAKKIVIAPATPEYSFTLSTESFTTEQLAFVDPMFGAKNHSFADVNKLEIYKMTAKDYPIPVQYPFANWQLNSIVYPFVVLKEDYILQKKINSSEYFDVKLTFASKRISELGRWGNEIPIIHTIQKGVQLPSYQKKILPWELWNWYTYNSWESNLSRYANDIDQLLDLLENLQNSLPAKIEQQKRILETLKDNQIILNIIITNSNKPKKDKIYIQKILDDFFSSRLNKIKEKSKEESLLKYTFNTLSSGTGKYSIYVNSDQLEGEELSNISIKFKNGTVLRQTKEVKSNNWLSFENIYIDKQEDSFSVLHPFKNISEDMPWTSKQEISIASNSAEVKLKLYSKDSGFMRRFSHLIGGHYLLSFEYNTFGDTFMTNFYIKNPKSFDKEKNILLHHIFHEPKITWKWTQFNAIVEVPESAEGIFEISTEDKNFNPKAIVIKNVSFIKLPPHPDILLKKTNEDIASLPAPDIRFARINPTLYKVIVKNATNPYTLVFSESFNSKWKIYPSDNNLSETSLLGKTMRFLGEILTGIVKEFDKTSSGEKSGSKIYFDKNIEELTHKNTLLSTQTFKTWGKKNIAGESHFVANSYANGWVIHPKDVNYKKDYTLIIEMTSQRYFYISLIISCIAVLATMSYIIKALFKK